MLKLYATIFSLFACNFFAQAQEYDFVVKSVFEPYVLTGASAEDISHALFFTVEQSWNSTDKKNKILTQFNLKNNSYQINDIKYQNSEIFPGELFYERSHSFQRITLGYQYLHLIDGFDTIGMESLNPTDLDISIFSKSYMNYRSVPALSYKLIFSNISLQFINVFQPKANTDNPYLLNQFTSQTGLTYIDDVDASKYFKRSDYGVRLFGSSGLLDWSLYGLNTYDKNAVYQFNSTQLTMTKIQLPYKSYGGNLTFDLSSNIIRLDFKYNDQRSFLNKNLAIVKTNEILFNFSYEPPEFMNTRLTFNYSHSELTKDDDYLTRRKKIQDVYIRLNKKINSSLNLSSMLIQRVSDSGYAAQFEIESNVSESHNFRLGAEYFTNKENTAFGLLKDFSRVYIGINAYTSNK